MLQEFRRNAEEQRRAQRFGRALEYQAQVEAQRKAMAMQARVKTEPAMSGENMVDGQ